MNGTVIRAEGLEGARVRLCVQVEGPERMVQLEFEESIERARRFPVGARVVLAIKPVPRGT